MQRSSFGKRLAAALIDGVIVWVASMVLGRVVGVLGSLIAFLGAIAYYVYFEGTTGQTLGKQAMKIKVVKTDGSGPIGISGGVLRYIGRIASSIPLLLGYFWMLWDPEKQTWHDKIASSYVVDAP